MFRDDVATEAEDVATEGCSAALSAFREAGRKYGEASEQLANVLAVANQADLDVEFGWATEIESHKAWEKAEAVREVLLAARAEHDAARYAYWALRDKG